MIEDYFFGSLPTEDIWLGHWSKNHLPKMAALPNSANAGLDYMPHIRPVLIMHEDNGKFKKTYVMKRSCYADNFYVLWTDNKNVFFTR